MCGHLENHREDFLHVQVKIISNISQTNVKVVHVRSEKNRFFFSLELQREEAIGGKDQIFLLKHFRRLAQLRRNESFSI